MLQIQSASRTTGRFVEPAVRHPCPFCQVGRPLLENELALVIEDRYPVSKGHVLIVPKRHVSDYFETSPAERRAMEKLLIQAKKLTDRTLKPDGYNVGVNVGEAAGQTVLHVHMHLIPRYRGDVASPRGGVRGVIPSKRSY